MTITLIDLASVLHPIWHTPENPHDIDECSRRTVAKIRAMDVGPHAAICLDTPPYHRKAADPTYKAQRPDTDARLIHQTKLAIDRLRADGFPCWGVQGFEADDIIASSVARVQPSDDVVIISNDKDLLSLVDGREGHPRVVARRERKNGIEEWDPARVYLEYSVWPNQIVDFLTLVGDSSDNVIGAKGVGPKKAGDLLKAFGTLEGIYTALDEQGTKFTPALATALREFQPRLDDVRNLIRLRTDAPIPFEEIAAERAPVPVPMAEMMIEEEPMSDEQLATPIKTVDQFDAAVAATVKAIPAPQVVQALAREAQSAQALVPAVAYERQLEPRNYAEARALATDMHTSALFSAYGSPQAVLATVLAGRELGLQAMAALRAFHIVEGKPTLAADAMRGLILRSGKAKVFRCTERTPERCTFVTQRTDDTEPMSLTYTMEEAKAAWSKTQDAWAKSGWGRFPADMLVARASAKLARLAYPDIMAGLYDPNELEG